MDLLTFELPNFLAAWLLFMAVAMFSSVAYALVCFYMAFRADGAQKKLEGENCNEQ